ncbi:MAG: hypothetical protein EU547_01060 [Promethearchaeota archaeon]|nr:MAG: hypothetical protein EU547_01060 [Candidatus Lokiarchaeota archaeon]
MTEVDEKLDGHFHLNMRRQGVFLFAFIIILLGYYGIINNMIMFDIYGNQIPYTDPLLFDPAILIWPFLTYFDTFFLPLTLLFGVCFFITYREDIPHYGIKASIWFVPIIISMGFIWYWVMFGFSILPFQYLFGDWKGYVNFFILFGNNLCGAISGALFKEMIVQRKEQKYQKGYSIAIRTKNYIVFFSLISTFISFILYAFFNGVLSFNLFFSSESLKIFELLIFYILGFSALSIVFLIYRYFITRFKNKM